MNKLDDLKGQLSVRAINCLKARGYRYLEQVTPEAVRRVTGKKTKKEILNFINEWNSMNDEEKIAQMKKADVRYNVEMQQIHEGEFISDNGNWTVTPNAIYFNYKDASYPVGDMEDVPAAVEEAYKRLKNKEV